MPRYPTAGITALSQLNIDADKDWVGMGISNLKELALGMLQGDVIVKGAGVVLIRIPAGIANTVFTSNGPGAIPSWQPGGLYLSRSIPSSIASSKSVTQIAGADQSISKSSPFTRAYDLILVVGGATRAPGGADVDETGAAQSAAINDMSLPPQTPGVGDAYRFGFVQQFDAVRLKYDTQGAGDWTITWKYWNGAWTNLAGVTDPTNGFKAATGTYNITFTRPGDWALNNILGMNLYWVTAEVTAYFNRITQPLGSQASIVRNS